MTYRREQIPAGRNRIQNKDQCKRENAHTSWGMGGEDPGKGVKTNSWGGLIKKLREGYMKTVVKNRDWEENRRQASCGRHRNQAKRWNR